MRETVRIQKGYWTGAVLLFVLYMVKSMNVILGESSFE